jgi:phage FluMu gp28-like protein
VIAREDGYTYIAALRSPDLRHTTKREGDTSVTVVTSKSETSLNYIINPST